MQTKMDAMEGEMEELKFDFKNLFNRIKNFGSNLFNGWRNA